MVFMNIIVTWFLLLYPQTADDRDAFTILQDVKNRYLEITDFSARATIVVDVEFVNIPDKEIEIFYKFPSKVKIRASDFALVPKKGMNFSIYELFRYEFSAIYVQQIVENNIALDEIKYIPLDKKSDLAIATLWIDRAHRRVIRLEGIPKKGGNFIMESKYEKEEDILPIQTQISFEIQQMKVPLRFFGNVKFDKEKIEDGSEGKVTIIYRDYKINQGLKDELFIEEDSTLME